MDKEKALENQGSKFREDIGLGGGTGQIIFAKRKLMRLMVFLYY